MRFGFVKLGDRAEGRNFSSGRTKVLLPIAFLPQCLQGLFLPSSGRQEVFPEPVVVAQCLTALTVYPVFDQSRVNKCKIPHLQHLVGRTSTA